MRIGYEQTVAFCLAFPNAAFQESDVRFLIERLPRGPEGVFDLLHPSGARLVAVLVERADSDADSADLVVLGLRGDPAPRNALWLEAVNAAHELAITGPRSVLQVALPSGQHDLHHALAGRGFQPAYSSYWMETRDAGFRLSTLPEGMRFRDWGPDLAVEPISALVSRAFAGRPGFMSMPVEDLRQRLLKARPAARMLLHEDSLIGLVRLRAPGQDGVGLVSLLARDPTWRGRGLGDLLLCEAMRSLAQAGSSRFALEVVTNNARAVALYERHGFAPVSTETTLQRRLRPIS